MSTLSEAYARGRELGERSRTENLKQRVADSIEFARNNYPAAAHLDFAAEVVKLDRERMQNPPDPVKYPETRGWPDQLREERRGFQEGSGCSELELAVQYTWHFFYSRRLNTRYIGKVAPRDCECSAAFIRDSREGGPLYGRNWDVTLNEWALSYIEPPREGSDGRRVMWMKGVSCSVMMDDEPTDIFPVDPFALMPKDCRTVKAAVEFLDRYRDFWGPTNSILIDAQHDSVAIEKANCRMGVRPATNGTSAVGACSFLVPEMKAFKEERDRLSIKKRGWTTENAPDWRYWKGADARYTRLLKLVAEAGRRGNAELWDMANIMTDHAVPFPDRVCLAGETLPTPNGTVGGEWTGCSHSEVLEGPNRRILFFAVEDRKPCYATPPYLVPGPGIQMKPEWKANTRPLPPVAKNPRPRIHCEYPAVRMML
jgi:hypothetical protein